LRGGEGEEFQGGMESSDEEDDTAAQLWACGEAPATAPSGYVYSATCPPLETEEQQRALVGRRVLVTHHTEPIGWHVGKILHYGVSHTEKRLCETANFKVAYTKKETNGELQGHQARELTSRNYGRDEWWMLLDQVGSS
jgi:hypothetical protein